jgi:hypothetical protein
MVWLNCLSRMKRFVGVLTSKLRVKAGLRFIADWQRLTQYRRRGFIRQILSACRERYCQIDNAIGEADIAVFYCRLPSL